MGIAAVEGRAKRTSMGKWKLKTTKMCKSLEINFGGWLRDNHIKWEILEGEIPPRREWKLKKPGGSVEHREMFPATKEWLKKFH